MRWLPIPGWEGLYEVSDEGQVRSLDRTVVRSDGAVRQHKGQLMNPTRLARGYLVVRLSRNGVGRTLKVHRLVALAFIGPAPEGLGVLHFDDDPSNNAVSNLRYGTQKENKADAFRNGRIRTGRLTTHCRRGHKRDEAARCRECGREDQQLRRDRAKGLVK